MFLRRSVLALLVLAVSWASHAAEVKLGGVKMVPVAGGKHHVWTDRVGSGPLKMLTLHGGPGFPHDYLEPFEDFLPQKGVTLYFYDQLGVGNSDQPDDEALWTVERYNAEVEEVRAGLGLDRFFLYGHSWGGMLAIEYALAHPERLRGLIISDMTASIPSYQAYAQKLRAQLPADVLKILDKYEAEGNYHAPEYEQTMFGSVYTKHLLRLDPWPEPVMRSLRKFNTKIYNLMQGPNEFVISGNFRNWDRWKDLEKINVPTLVIGGRHGTMSPDDLRKMAKMIPNARVVITEGSHMSMYDDQEHYFAALVKFIEDVQKGRMKSREAVGGSAP